MGPPHRRARARGEQAHHRAPRARGAAGGAGALSVVDGLDSDDLRTVDVDGVPTRVYEAGEGEPLVLVHGGDFGSLYSLDSWSLVLPLLARHFRVVAFDKLGQGHTGIPARDEDYTLAALQAHATSLLRQLDLGPVHLVGHSMGAFLIARIALDTPELVRSLVLVDSNTLAPDDPRYPWTQFYVDLAARTPKGPPTAEIVRMEPDAQSFSREHVTDDWVARLLENARLPTLQAAKERRDAIRETVWMPSLLPARAATVEEIRERGLPAPTLVVWARNDLSAPWPLALALYEAIEAHTDRAELHFFARAGHYVYREHPEAFTAVVSAFLEHPDQ